ncbi:hypothetical protein GF386_04990 [Candidatus Pacearchaeota archaeon]|nr:hypothetical protein [Candidatus Pacearchaeota archaeon]MBD3283469.1 hypothetical protein [Candidatus Pacearchaeota archaeon]
MTELAYREPVFKYQPERWTIRDQRVEELASHRRRLNRSFCILESQLKGDSDPCVSLETVERIYSDLRLLNEDAEELSGRVDGFDEIVVRDVATNTRVVKSYMDYFHPRRFLKRGNRPKIGGDCVNGVFGKGSWKALKNSCRPENFPHSTLDRATRMLYPMTSRSLDAATILDGVGELPSRLKQDLYNQLSELSRVTDSFCRGSGLMPDTGTYNLEFSRQEFSYWEAPNHLAALDEDRLLCYRPEGSSSYCFFSPFSMIILMHELGGHRAHDIYQSRIMPEHMVVTEEDYCTLAYNPCSEGTALTMEEFGFKWMTANRETLGLSEDDLRKTEMHMRKYVATKLPRILYGLLNLRERVEEKGDAEKDLAKLTGNFVYFQDPMTFKEDNQAGDYFQQLAYYYGQRRTGRLVKKMRKDGVPDDQMMHALMAGVWCDPKAQERFIFEHYLPAIAG